ncbi:MAG: FtsX-like permease family protein [Pseudohongiellaceae bacterium]
MLAHFTRMAFKALWRFKLHTAISLLSLIIGFVCFISAVLLSTYADSFDRHWPNADNIYNLIMQPVGDSPVPANFPIVNQPAARYLRTAFPEVPNIARVSTGYPMDINYNSQAATLDTKFVEPQFWNIFPLDTLHGVSMGEPLPPSTAMITAEAAQRLYGRTNVVGERLIVANAYDVTIAGVAATLRQPSHLESGLNFFNTELYLPMAMQEQRTRDNIAQSGGDPDADRWGNQSDYVFIQFPENTEVSAAAFNERLDQFVDTYMPPERAEFQTFEILPVKDLMPTQFSFLTGGFNIINALVVTGALVLLIGCLNYSNLVIAQLSLRSQEIGVQKILGAKRGMLLLQYSYESLLFLGFAMLVTLVIFWLLLPELGAMGYVGVDRMLLLNPSLWTTLLLALLVIVAIAGGYPAVKTALVPLVTMLRPKGASGYSGRLRGLMVGTQFFISGTLMILASVMWLQNRAMTQQLDGAVLDPKVAITVSTRTYSVDPELLITELRNHSAIVSVTQVDRLPWEMGNSSTGYSRSPDRNGTRIDISRHYVGFDYFTTMGIPLTGGRTFSPERNNDELPPLVDLEPVSGPYAIVLDRKAVQSLGWNSLDEALGESLYLHAEPPSVPQEMTVELTVIGGIEAPKHQFIDFSAFGSGGNAYFLRRHEASYLMVKVARESLNEGLRHIDETWSRLMPEIPLQRSFVDELFYSSYGIFLSVSVAIGALSVFGFLVASMGLLGNATFITNMRRKEVGIRKVMGASSNRLLRMLLLDFAKPILIANAIAWPLGYVLGNGYTTLFAASVEIGWMPFVLSLGLSALIAFGAVFSQSWKSARVRPARVLRYE